jgi:S-formylglutathione hydrolase FrmB
VLDWSLVSGVIPPVVLVLGCVALAFLLSRRRGRQWWRILVIPAMVAGLGVGVAAAAVALAAPFPDPVPAVVWWSLGAVLLAVSAAAMLLARGPHRSVFRPAVVLATVLVAVAAGNQVNVYFAQFPTARALLALPAVNQVDLPQVTRAAEVPVTRPAAGTLTTVWRPPPRMPVTGTVSEVAVPGQVSGFAARPAWVYLPPAYAVSPRPLLPVLVLLAGQPGSPRDWLDGGRLASTMDRFAAAHGGLAPVVVVPDPLGSAMANPLCLDSRLGRAQTYLAADVPAWVRAHLQVDPSPGSWAVGGASAGGTCALQLALSRPEVYPTFVDISGQSGPTLGDRPRTVAAAFGGDTAAFAAVNPLDQLARNRYPATAGFMVAGTDDPLYRPQAQQVVAAARRAGLSVQYRELPGGHDWRLSGTGLETALPWLATRLHLTG